MNRNYCESHSAINKNMDRCVLCWNLTDVPRDMPISAIIIGKDRDNSALGVITNFVAQMYSAVRKMQSNKHH